MSYDSISIKEEETREEDDQSSSVKSIPPTARKSKIIGPRHPISIDSAIREENILTYPRKPAALLVGNNPLTYNQPLKSNNHENWKKAIKREIQSMIDLDLWEVVPIKNEYKLVGMTQVLKSKRDEKEQIIQHKSWLFPQGLLQTQGKDY
ncbi:hypothetical protein O181_059665 [Austropuccinia psidii MF-1]|uniref:Gag-pol polyprotein n=1 Tax=Austropuccinia psidii MF-1 TaxID=1389203 RepID=A0A9Q3EIV9_9BASI|nr:hypothetical protein [Austropuccinia psidii MF-1]